MKKILNPYLNKEGYNCVCCAPNNPVGLHLEFWEEGEDVLTIGNPGEEYQTFTSLADGVNGSVKFIYKLDAIKSEE